MPKSRGKLILKEAKTLSEKGPLKRTILLNGMVYRVYANRNIVRNPFLSYFTNYFYAYAFSIKNPTIRTYLLTPASTSDLSTLPERIERGRS